MQADMVLYIIKLVLGGIAAFLAIMLWSKTRDAAWIALVAGTLIAYAGIVYDVLSVFGINAFHNNAGIEIGGVPLASVIFSFFPQLFYIAAFLIALIRKRF
ncbi:hypothetical protein H0R92_09340 [Treponema sp. OMZ 840]|uniref:hypothetical protein n=1 Tax=Treponema sp. OMZ 840 TaxID=244313 RepID=UPI003D8C7199